MADDSTPAKKPGRPAKKAAPKKTAAKRTTARKRTASTKVAEQQRALKWATQYSAPLTILVGWDPDTGDWDPNSPYGQVIAKVGRGAHVSAAAKACRLPPRTVEEMMIKGREYLADATVSEDRALVPVEIRPFVDFTLAVHAAEADTELTAGEKVYAAIDKDPRIGLTWLARRFPDRWAEQQQLFANVEYDPRDRAVAELLDDPNVALQLAGFARQAEQRAAGYDDTVD